MLGAKNCVSIIQFIQLSWIEVRQQNMSDLVVPRSWTTDFSQVFRPEDSRSHDTHDMTAAYPMCLNSVVLQPLMGSPLSDDGSRLLDYVSRTKKILRLNNIVSLPFGTDNTVLHSRRTGFKVKMTEPAISGYVDRSTTRVVVIQQEPSESNGTISHGDISNTPEKWNRRPYTCIC